MDGNGVEESHTLQRRRLSMDEDQKRKVGTFRFGVISDFVIAHPMARGEKERLLREKAERQWVIPYSRRTRISVSTITTWIRRYLRSGWKLESLYPQGRGDRGQSRALDEEVAQMLVKLRRELPRAPIRVLIEELKRRKIMDPWLRVSSTTVYRFLKRQGLWESSPGTPKDRRRFEAELPNDLWQSDMMYGPTVRVEGRQRKTFLFAFLDDMSRLIPHAQFYLTERLDNYLDSLRQALLRRGLPRRLYVGNGPAFRSQHLSQITASLGIALVHSTPYQPEGRGKVERWFRTVREQFLCRPQEESLEQLNQRFFSWLQSYHQHPHAVTGQTPMERFSSHLECLRPAPSHLEDFFRKRALRKVERERTVALNSRLYEAPVSLIGKKVALLYHDHDPSRVEIFWEERSYGFITLLDQKVNFRVRRGSQRTEILSQDNISSGGKLRFRKEEP
jgi:putative transposase